METVELTIAHLVVGGRGLARADDGRVVFVSGALPGERVVARITAAKRDFANADVVGVITASPDRVEPSCSNWQRGCGGCDWLHVAAPAQVRLKTEIVREALTRTARLTDPVVVAGEAVEPFGYRTTIRLAAGRAGGAGFRARQSHDVVEIDSCPVAHPRLNALLADAAVSARPGGEVTVRVGLSSGEHTIGDLGVVHETIGGHTLRVSAGSFFQSSPHAAELLVHAVARACADVAMADAVVVDAYGGIGLFAVTVAADAAEVVVVESSASSCADARHNLRGRRATVVQRRVEDWTPVNADLVVADPARSGLDKVAARQLAATGSSVIVLVSCDPGSLARDTRLLAELGYRHDGTEVLDVFPNTSHIESVSRYVCDADAAGRGLG